MAGGLRPFQLAPLNRGCVNTVVFLATKGNSWINLSNKKVYLTAKTSPWDDDADDADAVFKKLGTVPDPTSEPGRVVFALTETDSYLDPDTLYYYDIVKTDSDGSNAERLAIGSFNVIGGANNAQAGGDN